ncbi:MAG: OstA-like protein, partial [Bacteroidales bacterium]
MDYSLKEIKLNRVKTLFLKISLALWVCLLPLCMQAQRAGFTARVMKTHPSKPGYWLLEGNSQIVSKGNIVYSDKAEYNVATESCEAYGNLRIITKDKVKITGRILNYNGQTQLFDVIDNVVLVDGSVTMKTQRLLFDSKNNIATYNTPAEMTDKETVLTSKRGQYYGRTRTFQCRQDVIIVSPDYTIWSDTMNYKEGFAQFYGPTNMETDDYFMYCEDGFYNKNTEKVSLKNNAYIQTNEQTLFGDSIYYNLASKYGNVHRNVRMIDTLRDLVVKSEYAENNEQKGTAYFTKNVRTTMVEKKRDTLFLVSDTLKVRYDTSRQVQQLFAYNKVKFYRADLQGLCDSLSYDALDSVLYLHKKPLVWAQEYQIKGDTIRVWFKNQKPNS